MRLTNCICIDTIRQKEMWSTAGDIVEYVGWGAQGEMI